MFNLVLVCNSILLNREIILLYCNYLLLNWKFYYKKIDYTITHQVINVCCCERNDQIPWTLTLTAYKLSIKLIF